jgi:hypothetical protein
VIALEPEYILPQDGQEKQDREIEASQCWVDKYRAFYAKQGVTILGDDLFSRQPYCQKLKDEKLHFILVCKPDSHTALYEMVDFLSSIGVLASYSKWRWNARFGEIYTFRYAKQLLLRGDQGALQVNWYELSVTREDTGEMTGLAGRSKMRTTTFSKPKAATWNTISATAASIWLPCYSV